jgi:hypothetical protein
MKTMSLMLQSKAARLGLLIIHASLTALLLSAKLMAINIFYYLLKDLYTKVKKSLMTITLMSNMIKSHANVGLKTARESLIS